eukprot:361740-Chlamydomonas_euryale.AAC.1
MLATRPVAALRTRATCCILHLYHPSCRLLQGLLAAAWPWRGGARAPARRVPAPWPCAPLTTLHNAPS